MILTLLAASIAVPSVENLRAQAAGEVWEKCLMSRYNPNDEIVRVADVESLLDSAIGNCEAFEPEYLSAVMRFAPEVLKEQGIKHFNAGVTNVVAKETVASFKVGMMARVTHHLKAIKREK